MNVIIRRLPKSKRCILAPIFVTFLYCTSFLIADLGLSITAYAGVICVLCCISSLYKNIRHGNLGINKRVIPILIMMLIILITSLNNYDLQDNTKTYYLIMVFISTIAFGATDYTQCTVNVINKLVIYTGILFATLIYFFEFYPECYRSVIFSYLTEEAISDINFITGQGYSVFVYSDISYTLNMILFATYICLFNNIKKPRCICSIYLLGSLILSQRRTEIIFGIVSIFLIYVFCFYKTIIVFIHSHPLICYVAISICLATIGMFVIFFCTVSYNFHSSNRILMTIHDIKFNIDTSNGRSIIYEIAYQLVKENWFWGLGWMNFSHYAGASGISIARNVHNIYLQLLLECGVFFASIFFVCILIIVNRVFKNIKRGQFSAAGIAMITYIILAGNTDNTLYYPYFWIVFWISIYISGLTQRHK